MRPGGGTAVSPERRALFGAGLALTGVLVGAHDGAIHLVRTWGSSPTYNHGALVPVVSAGLIWIGWRPGERASGWPAALIGVAVGALAYAAGSVLDIRLGQHLGIALMVIAAAAALMGRSAATRHRFALAFLVFAVPFGEGLVPLLQEVTAWAIMLTTRLADVPAIRDGMIVSTPAGDFRVAEACAGLRFVIASLVTGVLCAHLFFIQRVKQVIMVLASVLVPVAANAVRASATVLVAEATDMRVAAGFDHLVYGWVFFAVVTGAVVFAAFHLAEPDAPRRPEPQAGMAGDPLPVGAAAGAIGLLCLFAGTG